MSRASGGVRSNVGRKARVHRRWGTHHNWVVIELARVVQERLVTSANFNPIRIEKGLKRGYRVEFFSFSSPTNSNRAISHERSFLAYVQNGRGSTTVVFLYNMVVVSTNLTVNFANVSTRFRVYRNRTRVAIVILMNIHGFNVIKGLYETRRNAR